MSVDPDYLRYGKKRYGMDHDRYDWSMLADRPPLQWPGGARLAVWINLAVQFFPLDQKGTPFRPPGGLVTAYPDLRHFTLRDYGNRIGVFRCLSALERYGFRPTFSISGALAERNPWLVERLAREGEVICSSWSMDSIHHGGMAVEEEEALVERSLAALRRATGQAVAGWLGPGRSQSAHTPELLAQHGVAYMCDWVNDDLPYPFRTARGDLVALPLSCELEDQFVIQTGLHSEWEYADQIADAADFLARESRAAAAGRLLALSVHPWLMGQPHRIGAFEAILERLAGLAGTVNLSAGEICRHCKEAWA